VSENSTFDDWLNLYSDIYLSPEKLPAAHCPNCSCTCLRLVLALPEEDATSGIAAFWCDNCLSGIALHRVDPRPGLRTVVAEDPASPERVIPDYRLVVP
jgi:hypothetical protein